VARENVNYGWVGRVRRSAAIGLGIIGGYLAATLGLTFYIRRRVGTRR
jgi:hypothetical protein